MGLVLGALMLLVGAGCSRRASPREEPRQRLDQSTMACLGAMRAYHRQADVHLARGNAEAAIKAVEEILGLPCLEEPGPEVGEALLDAYGRLGRLHLQDGQLEQAQMRLAEGLALPGPPSFFRANLHMVQGDLLDARASAKDKAGDKNAGDQLRRQAIEAFERSAEMNMRLLKELAR